MIRLYLDFISKVSLKIRLIIILFINSLVTLALVGSISYFNLRNVQENKIKSGIQIAVDNVKTNIEFAYDFIGNTSKQLAYDNNILTDLGVSGILKGYNSYIDGSTSFSDKQKLNVLDINNRIKEKISLVSSNQIVGNTLFYEAGTHNQVIFPNDTTIPSNFSNIQTNSKISQSEFITYHGIHKTISNGNFYTLSVSTKMKIPEMDNTYVYIETDSKWFDNLIQRKQYGMDAICVMTDSSNKIVFSENNNDFTVGSKLDMSSKGLIVHDTYYLFVSEGKPGWKIAVAIKKDDYNEEITKWIYQFMLFGLVSLGVTMIITILIWRTVYKPIRAFKREIEFLENNVSDPKIRKTRVKEFDELLLEFYEARIKTIELLNQIQAKEKVQKELELEKLLIQINPHFIHNTLNSIQWMARLNNQKKIVYMISLFTRVLNYNLGKKHIIVTVTEEVNALKNYIELMKIRYESKFDVIVDADELLMNLRIPRFILQPLVENAIFYGMKDEGVVVKVRIIIVDDVLFRISVEDNGEGMSPQQIERLLKGHSDWDKNTGLGIGLSYVSRMIKFYYGEEYGICIESEEGSGTVAFMQLPLKLKEDTHD